jgi:WD40 repeat protein
LIRIKSLVFDPPTSNPPLPSQFLTTLNEFWKFDLKAGKYFNVFDKIASENKNHYPTLARIDFSPDNKMLLVVSQYRVKPPVVYAYDLQTDKLIHSFALVASDQSVAVDSFVWSPDGHFLVLESVSGGAYEIQQPD